MRMRFFLILPEICASTTCSLSSMRTLKNAFGCLSMMTPMAGTASSLLNRRSPQHSSPAADIHPVGAAAINRKRLRQVFVARGASCKVSLDCPGCRLPARAAAVQVSPVELRDGRLALFLRGHLDEAEAARAARVAVLDDAGRLDRARLREQLLQIVARSLEREVPDVKFDGHLCVYLPRLRRVARRSFESKWLRRNGQQRRASGSFAQRVSGF